MIFLQILKSKQDFCLLNNFANRLLHIAAYDTLIIKCNIESRFKVNNLFHLALLRCIIDDA